MKRLAAIAALLAGIALPACAQHGGGHGGAHGGGFSGGHGGSSFHSSSGFHSGFRPSAPMGSRAIPNRSAPNYGGSRYPGSRGYAMGGPANRNMANRGMARPAYFGNRGGNHRGPYRQPYRSPFRRRYDVPLGWPGYSVGYAPWLGLGYWNDFDAYDQDYDNSEASADQAPPYYNGYDPQSDQQFPDSQPQYQEQPPPEPRPYYQPSATPPPAQTAVTLVFKDGRPTEQIHNYMLSRDQITVYDQHPHNISIDQIDLDATQKANREAGVDFHLPNTPGN